MTPREILTAARALIAEPERWTQGAYARDAAGVPVDDSAETAICWCASGALFKFSSLPGADRARSAVASIVGPIPDFNDHHTHAEVLAAFDKAIASCGEGEALNLTPQER